MRLENKVVQVYCSNGPLKGQSVSAKVVKRRIALPMPANPFYSQAIYLVSTQVTLLNEFIAVFSHCRKRVRPK